MTETFRIPLPHCPICGGWAATALNEVGTGTVGYLCSRGHSWVVDGRSAVVLGDSGSHDFPLEETVVYVAGRQDDTLGFIAAVEHLRRFNLTVLSPHEHAPRKPLPEHYRSFLLRSLAMIAKADVITLLPGWEEEDQVVAEVAFSRACGIHVLPITELFDLLHGLKEDRQ